MPLRAGVGLWVCGCVGVWVCGCVGVWVCGCVDVWVCGFVGLCHCAASFLGKYYAVHINASSR